LLFLAECYANRCFAEKLKSTIAEKGIPVKVGHTSKYGRDKIVKMLLNLQDPEPVIGVIDYEKGISRSYIDKNFELEEVQTGIFRGRAKRKQNIFVVVFDPNIEEAFICRKRHEICEKPYERRRVKSSNACDALSGIFSNEEIEPIARSLIEKINIVGDHQGSGVANRR